MELLPGAPHSMASAEPAKAAPAKGGGGEGKEAKGGEEAKPTSDLKKMLGMSAYEVIQEQNKANPRASVSRIAYVATLAEGTSQEACIRAHASTWAKLKEEEATSVHCGNPDMEVTGLLLVHPNCVVHIFETKCPNALAFLERLRDLPFIDPELCRVIFQSEDCPERRFKDWKASKVATKREDFDVEEGMDACDLAWDVYTALLKINETMLKRNEKDVMKSAAADAVPSSERVAAYARSLKWFSLSEYIEFYCDPVYVELESERVWPVQKFEKITGYLNE